MDSLAGVSSIEMHDGHDGMAWHRYRPDEAAQEVFPSSARTYARLLRSVPSIF